MSVSPKRSVTNTTQVDLLVRKIAAADCRLNFPSLGGLRGPAIFLNSNGQPIAAFVYHIDLQGLVEHAISIDDGGFHLATAKRTQWGGLAKVIKFRLFDETASGVTSKSSESR